MREAEKRSGGPLNQGCRSGYSPSGHCGAAYYCGEAFRCCAACPMHCNMRCGWLPEEMLEGME